MARRSRLSIPTRIFLGFAALLTAFGVVAITSLLQHQRTAQTLRLLDEGYLPVAVGVDKARATQTVFHDVLSQDEPRAAHAYLVLQRRGRPLMVRRALADLERASQLSISPEDQEELAKLRAKLEEVLASYRSVDAHYEGLFEALVDEDASRAEEVRDDLREQERRIDRQLRQARQVLQERIQTIRASVGEQERQATVLLGALTAFGLVLGLFVIWWAHRMLSPLPRLQERVAAVARGDYARKLEPNTDDELGRLAAEFERMVEALGARDSRLRDAAEAQRRLQRMQEQIVADLRAAVVVVDGEGVIRTINPAARWVLDLSEEAVGDSLEATGLLQRLPVLAEAVNQVARGAERAVLTGVPLGAESQRSVNVLVTPFGTEDAEGGSALIVAEDVTEELHTKSRLIQTERLAAIGRMAAHVTHEVRNPLSSIGLNVELLEDEVGDDKGEAKALLAAIHREIDRLTGITEEYLRLARIPEPRLEPEDVGELARSVVHFLKTEMERGDVRIELTVAPDIPSVAMDEQQIRQALLNLLRNAREAMPEGGKIWLRVEPSKLGVAVRIRDEGAGIPPEKRARIFDLFYTTKERGTGLGLPLTHQIVVAHGGSILCEAASEGGTVFELWLPGLGRAANLGESETRSAQTRALESEPDEKKAPTASESLTAQKS